MIWIYKVVIIVYQPLRWRGSFSLAAVRMVAKVQAAPPISPRIASMLAAGLIEIPPVSKVTPLPMKSKIVNNINDKMKSRNLSYQQWQSVSSLLVRHCRLSQGKRAVPVILAPQLGMNSCPADGPIARPGLRRWCHCLRYLADRLPVWRR